MNRLLLVEDDPTSRSFLLAASTALPATVDVADTVATAYALASTRSYDLWLIDSNLPDGSGSDLLARLRAEGHGVPAIAHTAAQDARTLQALCASGFVTALSKPLPTASWQDALRDVLASGTEPAHAPVIKAAQRQWQAPVWNREAALAAVGGNAVNADGLRALFLAELDGVRSRLSDAARLGATEVMRSELHRLRASCGFVGAERLGLAARLLHSDPASDFALQTLIEALDTTAADKVEPATTA